MLKKATAGLHHCVEHLMDNIYRYMQVYMIELRRAAAI
jgi:hypothetical protein